MTELAHSVLGPREGPPIVLLHGYPYDRRMWRFQVGPLSQNGYRVIAPDLAGFGHNDPVSTLSVDGMADDVVALLRRLKVQRAVLVGFSMGGFIALSLAARHPELVAGLILVDTRAEGDSPEAKAKREAVLEQLRHGTTRSIIATLLPMHLTEKTRNTQTVLAQEVRGIMLDQPKTTVAATVAALRDRPDRSKDLSHLKVPTLVLVGDQDAVTPPAAAKAIADGIPGAQLHNIKGAAHLSPMEQPEAVTSAILEWLAKMVPATTA